MVTESVGLPLAIVVLGRILSTKDSLNDWEKVHENVKAYLRKAGGTWRICQTYDSFKL